MHICDLLDRRAVNLTAAPINKESAINYHVNWDSIYGKYRQECEDECPDKKELANYAVMLCYEKYPRRGKKFLWAVASSGVLENLEQQDVLIPFKDDDGEYEYMGRRYTLKRPDSYGL